MLISNTGKSKSASTEKKVFDADSYVAETEAKLKNIIEAITGEKDAKVMISLASGSKYIYAADEKKSANENETQEENSYITVRNSGGGQDAVVVTELLPEIKGVIIVSSYAEDPVICNSITKAVKAVLDLSSTNVCVAPKSD